LFVSRRHHARVQRAKLTSKIIEKDGLLRPRATRSVLDPTTPRIDEGKLLPRPNVLATGWRSPRGSETGGTAREAILGGGNPNEISARRIGW
jgi:hypothetical protein